MREMVDTKELKKRLRESCADKRRGREISILVAPEIVLWWIAELAVEVPDTPDVGSEGLHSALNSLLPLWINAHGRDWNIVDKCLAALAASPVGWPLNASFADDVTRLRKDIPAQQRRIDDGSDKV